MRRPVEYACDILRVSVDSGQQLADRVDHSRNLFRGVCRWRCCLSRWCLSLSVLRHGFGGYSPAPPGLQNAVDPKRRPEERAVVCLAFCRIPCQQLSTSTAHDCRTSSQLPAHAPNMTIADKTNALQRHDCRVSVADPPGNPPNLAPSCRVSDQGKNSTADMTGTASDLA